MTAAPVDKQAQLTRVERRAVRLHHDPKAAARAANLRYVADTDAGFSRRRCGSGFVYLDHRGRRASEGQRRRIRALVIPPAWTSVWICAESDGHLQATGYDDRGRKQYLYHARWRAMRDEAAFDRLALIGKVLPAIRDDIARQMRRRTVDSTRVLAAMARLLDLTGIRVGNEGYERDNHTIGLTTLRWRHVHVAGADINLQFTAKSGLAADIAFRDRALARLLNQLAGASDARVFQVDGTPIHADELNDYLSTAARHRVTAKDFRTWRGTVSALAYLREQPRRAPTKRTALAAIDAAAQALRNTRAVARAHYVHPGLIARYLAGELDATAAPEPAAGLDAAEQILVGLLPLLSL